MERLKHLIPIQKAKLLYDCCDSNTYQIGIISQEFYLDKCVVAYIFDLDEEMFKHLKPIDPDVGNLLVPGVFVDEYGYYQAWSNLPFFISSRVIDPRRSDIDDYLKMYNMDHYDPFTMLLRNKGRSADNLHVEEIPVQHC